VRYRITHRTEYSYAEPVTLCHNETHLTPRAAPGQRLVRHDLHIEPGPAVLTRREDFFGNPVAYFAVQSPHPKLAITAESEVERDPVADDATTLSTLAWEEAVGRTHEATSAEALDARQCILASPMVVSSPAIAAYAARSFPSERPLGEAVRDLTGRIHRDFVYEPGVTTIATPVTEVFERRRGVCQDFSHLAIACLRAMGLGARYVSGYIETVPPPGRPRLVGADASHAWVSAYDPEAGWIDVDPTNDQFVGERYVTTAWGRDYADVTPIKGIFFGGGPKHTATVTVDVERIEA
jgi:transglutaminase-like putative cysteine protease